MHGKTWNNCLILFGEDLKSSYKEGCEKERLKTN